ncbi:MAG: pitrilysin family protein [Pseudomonadota bacterium]
MSLFSRLAPVAATAAAALMIAAPLRAEIDIAPVTSPGGIDAWLVEDSAIPFTALELRFAGGASLDPEGKRGAMNLMVALLEEGAADMDAEAFSVAAEELAARFSFDVGDDTVAISAQFLTENRDEALDLLRKAITEPRFDEDAIERVRGQVLSGIASDLVDPSMISNEAFSALAFPDHPYGSAHEGTRESVSALTRSDLIAAKERVMARDRVFVGAVGDITAEDLGPILDALLGDLPETGAPLPEETDVAFEGGLTVVEFETPQSVITFGQPGIARDDPDFFPAFVVNQIFGAGGFGSRLMDEVRRERGLTYGIYTSLVARSYADMLVGRVSTVNARVGETVEVVTQEWARLADEGITQDELDRAKTYLTGAYPLRFDGNERIANILVGMQLDGMPIDYVNTRNAQVEAVTLEDANRVAQSLFRPEDLHLVIVGQPEGLEPGN